MNETEKKRYDEIQRSVNPRTKVRRVYKIEEDGSKTTAYTLEINGENKLHNWEGPALINEEQKLKEYYLNGIIYEYDIWNEIKKSGEGLPWYKQSGNTTKTSRF